MRHVMMLIAMLAITLTAFAREIPWEEHVIGRDPCVPGGLHKPSPGYDFIVLSGIGRDGEAVSRYEGRTQGRHGSWAEIACRPGREVEAECKGTRLVILDGCKYEVETWEVSKIVACGNPTVLPPVYRWFKIKTVTVKGKDGHDGRDGCDGKDGRNGINGRDGKDGIDGVNGRDGKDGKDGKDGEKGEKGDTVYVEKPCSQPNIIVNNVTFATQNWGSGQMMGVYGSSVYQYQLLGVGLSPSNPTSITVNSWNKNINQNPTAITNVNTNVTNTGDKGSATGNGSGDSIATSGQ